MYGEDIRQQVIESFAKGIFFNSSFWFISEHIIAIIFLAGFTHFLPIVSVLFYFCCQVCNCESHICTFILSMPLVSKLILKRRVFFYISCWKNSTDFIKKLLCFIWKMLQKLWCFYVHYLPETHDEKCKWDKWIHKPTKIKCL